MDIVNLAVISFDGIHLLLPQQAVATIELASNIKEESTTPESIGALSSGGRNWPAYALTANFDKLTECPPIYKFCIALTRENEDAFSIACEEVSTISVNQKNELKPLQICMQLPLSPVQHLLLKENKFMLVSDIDAMYRFLNTDIAT